MTKVLGDDERVDLGSKVAVTKYLKARVRDLIARANREWDELHADDDQPQERLLPLIRVRVSTIVGGRDLSSCRPESSLIKCSSLRSCFRPSVFLTLSFHFALNLVLSFRWTTAVVQME